VDYSDDFEVPVFRSAASAEAAHDTQSQVSSAAEASGFPAAPAESDSSAVGATGANESHRREHSAALSFTFRRFRNPGRALGLLVFTLIWSG